MMDSAKFGEFHQQIKRNQDELTSYLKELDSWKEEISKKDSKLNAGGGEDSKSKGSHSGNVSWLFCCTSLQQRDFLFDMIEQHLLLVAAMQIRGLTYLTLL